MVSGTISRYKSATRSEREPVLNKADIFQSLLGMASRMLETATAGRENAEKDAADLIGPKETRYDTSREGAQALAAGFMRQMAELEAGIVLLERALDDPKLMAGSHESVGLASLVELENGASGASVRFVIAPALGGEKIEVNQKSLLVVTPQSPVCRKLMGKEAGDSVEIQSGGKKIIYTIASIE
jgi:transcription elongation GreA/GreB family factor